MYKNKFLIFTLLLSSIFYSQNKKIERQAKDVVEEGKILYRLEMASWYGSDVFMEKFPNKTKNIGGYISYIDKNIAKCVFFSKDATPKTLGIISFDSTYNVKKVIIDETERDLSAIENDLYQIRAKTLERINSGTDTIFKFYKKSNYNIIPLIKNNQKKVFILTGTTENGKAIIGNDYLLTFDKKNNILSTERLHNSLLYFETNNDSVGGAHNHLNGKSELITSTDICTLMLYSRFSNWENHYVISKDYVSIWDCKKNELKVMKYEDWAKENNLENKN
jgi:hypothetical protein